MQVWQLSEAVKSLTWSICKTTRFDVTDSIRHSLVPCTEKIPIDTYFIHFTCQIHQFYGIHDDVIKWKHFPRNWPFVREIHRSPVNFPHKGQWRGALMFSLNYAWINDWVNNREAGDLRRQHGHYDVIVMKCQRVFSSCCTSARHAERFDCLMNSLILITMDNGRGHCAWWQFCKVPNQTQGGIENWKV